MPIAGIMGCEALQIAAIRMHREDIEVGPLGARNLHTACEHDAATVRRPQRQIVVALCYDANLAGLQIQDGNPTQRCAVRIFLCTTEGDLLAIRRVAREASIEDAVVRQLLQTCAITAHTHQLGAPLATLGKPLPHTKHHPFTIG